MKRKTSIIDFKNQARFALEFLAIQVVFLVIFLFFLLLPEGTLTSSLPSEFIDLLVKRWWYVLFALALFFMVALFFSHRLWGNIHGLKLSLVKFLHGDLDVRVHFRKTDYLLPVKKDINEFFEQEGRKWRQVETFAKQASENLHRDQNELAAENVNHILSLVETVENDS